MQYPQYPQHPHPQYPQYRFLVAGLAACLSIALPQASQAALGGTADSIAADQSRMAATRHVASHTGYDVHELTLASGTVVREFVGTSGTVFGVAWQGPFKPDLQQLLGSSFSRMTAAAQQVHGGHRRLGVHTADLVIDSGGKMRGFAGRAYLPALLPAGVAAGEIQ